MTVKLMAILLNNLTRILKFSITLINVQPFRSEYQ